MNMTPDRKSFSNDAALVAELVERARAIAPRITARAEEAERTRHVHAETIREVAEAGLFQILVPKRFGGYELNASAMVEVLKVLSPLCVSTGWVIGFYMVHNWMWCILPEKAQEEIFNGSPYALGPVMVGPMVKATPVEGGYRITGRAKWGTGSSHASWCMVGGTIEGDTPPVSPDGKPMPKPARLFAMPWDAVTLDDTWKTSGMAATASHDIVFDDIFIPEHRVVDVAPSRAGQSIAARLYDGPVYSAAFTPLLAVAALTPLVAASVGNAAYTIERAKTFASTFSGKTSADNPAMQIRLAKADLSARAACVLLDDLVADIERDALSTPIDINSRALQRAKASHIASICREVVTQLAQGSGASAHMLDSPVQRAFRDITMAANHVVFDFDPTMELHGKMLIGKPPEVIMA